MPRRRADDRQLSLDRFLEPPKPGGAPFGDLNFDTDLRTWLKTAIKECALSRDEIAARMSRLLGCDPDDPSDRRNRVTKALLDAWTGQSKKEWRMPVAYLPAFVTTTDSFWLLDQIARRCGCRILVGEEALLAKWGSIQIEKHRIAEEERALKKLLPRDLRPKERKT